MTNRRNGHGPSGCRGCWGDRWLHCEREINQDLSERRREGPPFYSMPSRSVEENKNAEEEKGAGGGDHPAIKKGEG